ncbi:septal ring lytic transglycosylase RlpA family protein [Inhella proteolytica]|uniref:Endolytic peptidoglycan transglycosylase RlpA n=1 Tax=Inhella proteolytica TaxID=2795029 RepID=A0A931J2B0_9BURK|nr:septal ring lytic transglycosylase RlpA family protein [Inhella proteolytica]MBH9576850.1 septal ring lytic transglycosylase RlpA family protein [Inhella proteolytica]
MRLNLLLALLLLALLQACATRTPAPAERDGPELQPPPDLQRVPDAVPRIEPIRPGGANKPYEIDGVRYVPLLEDLPYEEGGLASWYGRKFHGRQTASGETYNMYAMTAAHPRWPLPSYARVRNPANGREVIVRVNDRGPFAKGRVIDLSYSAALKLDLLRGVAPVQIQRLSFEDIRTGRWRREPEPGEPPTQVAQASEAPAEPVPEAAAQVRAASPGLWLQIGAFRALEGAVALKQRVAGNLAELEPLLTTLRDRGLHRVQLGPFDSLERAQEAAQRLRSLLALQPLLVQR